MTDFLSVDPLVALNMLVCFVFTGSCFQRFGHPPSGMPKTLKIWEWGASKRGNARPYHCDTVAVASAWVLGMGSKQYPG